MLSAFRKLLKIFHPEGIPWPASLVYNAISSTTIFQRHYDLVAKNIVNYCPQGSILDIGTGPGWLLISLHHHAPSLQLTGLDVSPGMVHKAQQNLNNHGLHEQIAVRVGNANAIPFPDNTFDVVVSTGSIHHWKEPLAGLNEVYRILKPGGQAFIYDLVSDTPMTVLQETAREYGRFNMLLLWIHAFEEPFYSCQAFADLPHSTLFHEGQTRFVGVMCCLGMKKP